jgi:hypothetical protein
MTNRFHLVQAGAAIAAALVAGAPVAAHAETGQDMLAMGPVPVAEMRAIFGTGVGFEAAGSLASHRLRLEAEMHGWGRSAFSQAAALVRVLGPATDGLWLRAGYMYQMMDFGCGMSDTASTVDAGVAYRKRWPGRSLFFAEGGVERLTRADSVGCNDSGLGGGASLGARVSVGGQYSFARVFGVYGRATLRTADHLREIGFLPELFAGLAFEI